MFKHVRVFLPYSLNSCEIWVVPNTLVQGKSLPQGGQTIRVFSLDGTPLKEYKLDHSVSGIWVDEQAGKMWALDVNSDEPLVEYRLK